MIRECRYFAGDVEDRYCDRCKVPCSAAALTVGPHAGHPHRPLAERLGAYAPRLWRDEAAEFTAAVDKALAAMQAAQAEGAAVGDRAAAEIRRLDEQIAAATARRAALAASASQAGALQAGELRAGAVETVRGLLAVAKFRLVHGVRYSLRGVLDPAEPEHAAAAELLAAVDADICAAAGRLARGAEEVVAASGDAAAHEALREAVAALCPAPRGDADSTAASSSIPAAQLMRDLCPDRVAAKLGRDVELGTGPLRGMPAPEAQQGHRAAWLRRQLDTAIGDRNGPDSALLAAALAPNRRLHPVLDDPVLGHHLAARPAAADLSSTPARPTAGEASPIAGSPPEASVHSSAADSDAAGGALAQLSDLRALLRSAASPALRRGIRAAARAFRDELPAGAARRAVAAAMDSDPLFDQ